MLPRVGLFLLPVSFLILPALGQNAPSLADFFDDTQIQDIRLTVDPTDWATLRKNYLDSTYYQAQFTWRGITNTVGIRSHGNGSRSPVKPNLDVNIDKYVKKQTFLGSDFFILKANNQDPTTIHEKVAFKMFEKMGLPTPRESPARVYVNDEFFGFYYIVEHMDEAFLSRNFGENTGYFYEYQGEVTYNFEYLGSDPNLYAQFLDLKSDQDDPDLQWFADFVTAINQTSDSDFVSAVSKYVDPKLYLTHVAIENVVGEVDGIAGGVLGMNNFYLYRFAGGDLSQLVVWDKDLSFLSGTEDIFSGTQVNILVRRLIAVPEYRAAYFDALQKAATLFGGANGWADQEINREYTLIHDVATNDPNKQCISNGSPVACTASDFETGITSMHAFVATRAPAILKQLSANPYQLPAKPLIISAKTDGSGGGTELAPGSLVTVEVQNFPMSEQPGAGDTLPRNAGNTTFVAINGVRAPIASAIGNVVTIQVPWDFLPGTVSLVASNNGQLGNSLSASVTDSAPAIFILTHADSSTISSSRPIVAGETLSVFCTGLGITGTYFDAGVPSKAEALATVSSPVSVSLGDTPTTVLYAGLAPGYAGLYQVNLTSPVSVSSGTLPLSLSVAGHTAITTVAIQ